MLILVSGVWYNALQVIAYITEEIIHVFRYTFTIRDTMSINYLFIYIIQLFFLRGVYNGANIFQRLYGDDLVSSNRFSWYLFSASLIQTRSIFLYLLYLLLVCSSADLIYNLKSLWLFLCFFQSLRNPCPVSHSWTGKCHHWKRDFVKAFDNRYERSIKVWTG